MMTRGGQDKAALLAGAGCVIDRQIYESPPAGDLRPPAGRGLW
jgi:hypothetical protein